MKLIECPRDAMQGLDEFIPTERKAEYINQLLKVGFDTIDFGSFVSPKAIPQLRDTVDVLKKLDLSDTNQSFLQLLQTRGALKKPPSLMRSLILVSLFPFLNVSATQYKQIDR